MRILKALAVLAAMLPLHACFLVAQPVIFSQQADIVPNLEGTYIAVDADNRRIEIGPPDTYNEYVMFLPDENGEIVKGLVLAQWLSSQYFVLQATNPEDPAEGAMLLLASFGPRGILAHGPAVDAEWLLEKYDLQVGQNFQLVGAPDDILAFMRALIQLPLESQYVLIRDA